MGKEKSIKEKLKEFKNKIKKDFSIREMILFGSRAKGKTGKDVDVDLILVSPEFKGLDFFQRGAKMYDYWDFNYPVDFLCYTPEEFKRLKNRVSIVKEALSYGVVIK